MYQGGSAGTSGHNAARFKDLYWPSKQYTFSSCFLQRRFLLCNLGFQGTFSCSHDAHSIPAFLIKL